MTSKWENLMVIQQNLACPTLPHILLHRVVAVAFVATLSHTPPQSGTTAAESNQSRHQHCPAYCCSKWPSMVATTHTGGKEGRWGEVFRRGWLSLLLLLLGSASSPRALSNTTTAASDRETGHRKRRARTLLTQGLRKV